MTVKAGGIAGARVQRVVAVGAAVGRRTDGAHGQAHHAPAREAKSGGKGGGAKAGREVKLGKGGAKIDRQAGGRAGDHYGSPKAAARRRRLVFLVHTHENNMVRGPADVGG